jgi:hypothetical protein
VINRVKRKAGKNKQLRSVSYAKEKHQCRRAVPAGSDINVPGKQIK